MGKTTNQTWFWPVKNDQVLDARPVPLMRSTVERPAREAGQRVEAVEGFGKWVVFLQIIWAMVNTHG